MLFDLTKKVSITLRKFIKKIIYKVYRGKPYKDYIYIFPDKWNLQGTEGRGST